MTWWWGARVRFDLIEQSMQWLRNEIVRSNKTIMSPLLMSASP
jgi:hypothetical protein